MKRLSVFMAIFAVLVFVFLPLIVFAQPPGPDPIPPGPSPEDNIFLGPYALPVVLTAVLMLIFNFAGPTIPDRFKPLIACGVGIVLGWIGLVSAGLPAITAKDVVHYGFVGFMAGLAAVGWYEVQKTARKSHRV